MKTTFVKKMMPAAVFVLAISGAFLTTSMQQAEAERPPILGYVDNHDDDNPCDIQVSCKTEQGDICRLNGDTGPQAFAYDNPNSPTSCLREVYRPD